MARLTHPLFSSGVSGVGCRFLPHPSVGRDDCVWAVLEAVLLGLLRSGLSWQPASMYFSVARCKAVKRRENEGGLGTERKGERD